MTTCGPRSAIRTADDCSTCSSRTAAVRHRRSAQLPITRQAVSKHLAVLDRVGLVHMTPAGRERRYQVDEAQLARAVAQLSAVGATWDARLQRIKRIAEAIQLSKPRLPG